MLTLGTLVRFEGGTGTIDRTSMKLYRVKDRWFTRDALSAV